MKISIIAFVAALGLIGNASAMNWGGRSEHNGQDYVEISTSAAIPTQTVTRTYTEVPAAVTHTVTDVPAPVTRTVTNVPAAVTNHVIPKVEKYELGVNERPHSINTNTTTLMNRIVIDVTAERIHKNGAGSLKAAVGGIAGTMLAAAILL